MSSPIATEQRRKRLSIGAIEMPEGFVEDTRPENPRGMLNFLKNELTSTLDAAEEAGKKSLGVVGNMNRRGSLTVVGDSTGHASLKFSTGASFKLEPILLCTKNTCKTLLFHTLWSAFGTHKTFLNFPFPGQSKGKQDQRSFDDKKVQVEADSLEMGQANFLAQKGEFYRFSSGLTI